MKGVNVCEVLQISRTHLHFICSYYNEYKIFSVMRKTEGCLKLSFTKQACVDWLVHAGYTKMTMTWSQIYVAYIGLAVKCFMLLLS